MSARLYMTVGIIVMAAWAGGCTVATELGKPCTLIKANPDGGLPLNVEATDITSVASAGQDFISFGTPECENLTCVIDSAHLKDAVTVAQQNPGAGILGYCSLACSNGTTSQCSKQYNDAQNQPTNAMSCRQLVLDPDTLAALCSTNPKECRDLFGTNPGSYYCARGADAGH